MRRRPLAAAVALAATAACSRVPAADRDTAGGSTTPLPQGRVALTRLRDEPYSFAYSSGYVEPAQLVLRDTASLRAAWERVHERQGTVPAPPAFDPATEQLVLVAIGQRGSGGYSILLDSAAMAGDTLVVYATSTSPGRRCGATAALTQPVDIARMPRVPAPARFVLRQAVTECDGR